MEARTPSLDPTSGVERGPQREISEAEERWRAFATGTSNHVIVVGADDRIVFCNHDVEGVAAADLIGLRALDLAEGEHKEQQLRAFATVRATGETVTYDAIARAADGRVESWMEVRCVPILRDGGVSSILVLSRDIARRKQAEQALERSERRFRALIERSSDAVALCSADGVLLYVSPSVTRILGFAPDELVGRSFLAYVHEGDQAAVVRTLDDLVTHPEASHTITFRGLHKDGSWRWVASTAANLLDEPSVRAIVGNFRDVTEAERERETRERLAAIVASTDDAILVVDADGIIEEWSGSAERIYGYSLAEARGRPVSILVEPGRAKELGALLHSAARGEALGHVEATHLRKGGGVVDVSLSLAPLRDARDGSVRTAVSIVARDISEQKRLRARLLERDRMIAMGTLAAGVAHEINNPLTFVTISHAILEADLQAAGVSLPPVVRERMCNALRDAKEGTSRVAAIVGDLKTFSRPDEESVTRVDVRPVVLSSLRMARSTMAARASVVTDLADVPDVLGNEAQLGQVLLNLMINAAEAIPEGQGGSNEIRVSTRTADDGRAVIAVKDTGPGIPAELQDRIFEPFFSTKPFGVGTGLGLAICNGMVARMGGTLRVESEVGRGALFEVTLPAAEPSAPRANVPALEARATATTTTRARARRGKILLVDDEPALVKLIERVVAREHDVFATTSARVALERIAAGEAYDLILCDLMMPELSGMALYDRLADVAPALQARIVFLTGGAFTPEARAFLGRVKSRKLDKPFDEQALLALVREQLA